MPISPNMNLNIPIPSVTNGPQYAEDISNNFNVIDAHDHSPGNGSPISISSLSGNANLDMNAFSVLNLKSTSLLNQLGAPTENGSIYMSGNDLYWKDGTGSFTVQITSGGSVTGSSGTITGLPSGTASATYIAGIGTFKFQAATNTAGSVDVGSVLIRKLTASSNAITIAAPNALASDFSLTLPSALPVSNSLIQSDTSGNLSFVSTSAVLPVGTIVQYGGSVAPSGWLLCNGQVLDSVANPIYASLFAVIGTTYGGTGASNFAVPNTSGIFVRGAGSQTISGQTYSGTLGTQQVDNLESHNHGGATGSSTVPVTTVNIFNNGSATGIPTNTQSAGSGTISGSGHTHTISASGSGTETYPANITLTYIIKI